MAYYRGDYYRGKGRGDYYRGKGRGDPGFWSAIGRGIGVIGAAVAAPYTGGASLGMIPSLLGGAPSPVDTAMNFMPRVGGGIVPNSTGPELKALMKRPAEMPIPSGRVPGSQDVIYGMQMGGRRRRTMNPGNVKALRRSLRRVSSFGRLCRSAKKAIGQAATAVGARRPLQMRRLTAGRK